MTHPLLRTKSIEQSLADTDEPEYQLKRSLGALDLTVFGVGVIIGAGIFTLTGRVAHNVAGPAVVLSFVVAAVCCALAAMCYAEFASTVPVSGSAYTFSYAALGEVFAWIIGWDLLLEMVLAVSVVAQGWSAYFGIFLDNLAGLPVGQHVLPAAMSAGGAVDLPALVLICVLGVLMIVGITESARVNLVMVILKVFIVFFVIFAGLAFVHPENWTPFVPDACVVGAAGCPSETPGTPGMTQPLLQAFWHLFSDAAPSAYGVGGIFAGAALVFFAYIGFDVVATTAEEAKNPRRDVPIGIIGSLIICTVLYCVVSLVVTGMVPYDRLDPKGALAAAFKAPGVDAPWMATLISAGAVAGLTTVVLTLMIGSSRLIFAMSRDNLLPMQLAKVHPRFRTPWLVGVLVTVLTALVAALTPLGNLEEMVNIGTLSAFVMVSIAVPLLRHRRPDLRRPFRVPGSPVVPILSALVCFYLMLNLSVETWLRFVIWLVVGFALYFAYSFRHSRVGTGKALGGALR